MSRARKISAISNERASLIVKKFTTGLTKEEKARLVFLDRELDKLSPVVTDYEIAAMAQITKLLNEVKARNDKRDSFFTRIVHKIFG